MSDAEVIRRSLEIIEQRIAEYIDIGDIANSVFYSKHYYQRMFHAVMGEPVMEYVKRRRLYSAGVALSNTRDSILDIALNHGYGSHEAFTRAFKAYAGVTPSTFRRLRLSPVPAYYNNASGGLYCMDNQALLRNTEDIARGINAFVAKAAELCTATREIVQSNQLPNFTTVIANETQRIIDNVNAGGAEVQRVLQNKRAVHEHWKIVKYLEDAAFKCNILAFAVNIQIARTAPPYRDIVLPLSERYLALAYDAAQNTRHIHGILRDMASTILEDIRNDGLSHIRALSARMCSAANVCETSAASIEYFVGLRDEQCAIARELRDMARELDQASGDLSTCIPVGRKALKHIEDCVFRLEILLLAGRLDTVRHPQFDETPHVERSLNDMAACVTQCGELLSSAEECMSLLKQNVLPEQPSQRKVLEDILFQTCILSFYMRYETQIIHDHVEDVANARLVQVQSDVNACTARINDMIRDTSNDDLKGMLITISDDVHAIAVKMKDPEGIPDGANGALCVIGAEYQNLAQRIRAFAEQV